jgi:BMFP domain-containing protein YqiC
MAKKLLVKTPQTIDGSNLRYDENRQVIFKTSIVELGAKKNFESLNAKLPAQLRHEFEVVDIDTISIGSNNEDLKKKLADLESQQENADLKKKIEELEAKLAGKTPDPKADVNPDGKPETVVAIVAKIKEATTVDEVNEILGADDRKGVKDAAAKKIEELEAKN